MDNGPHDGERVMFCAHADLSKGVRLVGTFHWHMFVPAETVTRKDNGEDFECTWFALCEACMAKYSDDPPEALQQDGDWIGEPPNITRVI